jgi:hypothetical protein
MSDPTYAAAAVAVVGLFLMVPVLIFATCLT